jgi:ABC-2 type transport system permease protein
VWSGYLGLVVYSAAAVAIGLFVSSLTESQVIAFFTTFVILFVLHMLGSGLTLRFLPPKAEWVATFMSFDSRLTPFVRGLIQPRDVIYFLSITAACLTGSFWALERRKWA